MEVITLRNQRQQQEEVCQLKQSFNNLTDRLGEELDKLREENFRQLKDYQKQNDTKFVQIISQIKENQTNNVEIQRDMFQQLKQLNNKIQSFSDNEKLLFQKLTVIANSNTEQIELLGKESQTTLIRLGDISDNFQEVQQSFTQIQQSIIDLDEKMGAKNISLIQNITNNQMEISNLSESMKIDTENIFVIQDDFRKTLSDLTSQLSQRVEQTEQDQQKDILELQNIVQALQMEVQENLQDLAQIHKSSSNQIITDFENALSLINEDIQKLFQQMNEVGTNMKRETSDILQDFQQKERKTARQLDTLNKNLEYIKNQSRYQQFQEF